MWGRRGIAAAVSLAALAAGCSDGDVSDVVEHAAGQGGDLACRPQGDESVAKALLRCAEPSIAFVQTPYATGTGVVIEVDDERFVVTNFHVVEPFRSAKAEIDGEVLAEVPLVGADASADIALLGPIEARFEPLEISAGNDLERGDDVYLIGYPGESVGDEHETTISSGIVSRLREVDEWDQLFIQSDAAISGGQSGGPLFDGRSRFVGISGLSFAEEYALVLSGADVQRAADRIAAGDGDDVLTVPAYAPSEGGSLEGTVKVDNANDFQFLVLPPSRKNRTLSLTVPAAASNVSVAVYDTETGDVIAQNAASIDLARQLSEMLAAAGVEDPYGDFDIPPEELVTEEMRPLEIAPGTFEIEVEADHGYEIEFSAPTTSIPVDIAWTSSLELWPSSLPVDIRKLAVGETDEGLLNAFDTSVDYLVELEAGAEVDVWARSPQGDMSVEIIPPGVVYDAVLAFDFDSDVITTIDDSEEGLYGYDAHDTFTAEASGVYRFKVMSYTGAVTTYRFSVTEPDTDERDEQ